MELETIHPKTALGNVKLRVRSLPRSIEFYTNNLGFKLIQVAGREARLGAGDRHLLTLNEDPSARAIMRTAGLYHFAILVPSRTALANSLHQLVATQTPLQGFADHLVSEAIYLADPDGSLVPMVEEVAHLSELGVDWLALTVPGLGRSEVIERAEALSAALAAGAQET